MSRVSSRAGRLPTRVAQSAPTKRALRGRVKRELQKSGFQQQDGLIVVSGTPSKDEIRLLHSRQRGENLAREARFIARWQKELLPRFASGREVTPSRISPRVVQVESEEDAALFR